jgi:hypothetical protein
MSFKFSKRMIMQSYDYLSNDTMKPIIRSTDREGGREGGRERDLSRRKNIW